MARWLLGEEPVQVYATASCLVDPEIGRLGDVDTARTVLKTASGKLCVISNTRRSGYGYDQRIEAFGSSGMLNAGNVQQDTLQTLTEAMVAGAPIHPGFAVALRRRLSRPDPPFRRRLSTAAPNPSWATPTASPRWSWPKPAKRPCAAAPSSLSEGIHMHKVVLIGAGRIGRIHAKNAAFNPRIELAGVVDAIDASAQSLAQEYATPVLTLDQAMDDPSVAGVIIASSTDTHLDYSVRAAAAGKAIFCEKPIDQDLARARSAADVLVEGETVAGLQPPLRSELPGAEGAAGQRRDRHAGNPADHLQRSQPSPRRPTSRCPAACSRTWPSTTSTWPAGCWARKRSKSMPPAVAWSIRRSAGSATSIPRAPC